VSAMSKTFVKDPRDVAKPGDIVRVKVLEVDMARKRIALTLRLDDEVGPRTDRAEHTNHSNRVDVPGKDRNGSSSRAPPRHASTARGEEKGGALADALRRAGLAEKRK